LPVQVLYPISRTIVLDVTDTPEYNFYAETKRERAFNNSVRGKLHFALKRFYIQAGGAHANVRRRMSAELEVNIREKTDSLGGLVLWQASRSTSLALVGGTAERDYGGAEFEGTNIAQTLNRTERVFDAITYVQPSANIRFSLDGRFGSFRFADAASRFKNANSFSILGGFEFTAMAADEAPSVSSRAGELRGGASVGFTRFDVLDPAQTDGSSLTGDANLSFGVMRATTLRIRYVRNFAFSFYSSGTFYLYTTAGAGLARFLSRTATLSYDLSFGRGTYPGSGGGTGAGDSLFIRSTTHTVALQVQLSPSLVFELLGFYGRRVRGAVDSASQRGTLALSLVYGAGPATVRGPAGGLAF
jgi:Putative beta-barrel porin 2